MDKDYQEYKDFDMTGAVRGIPPQVARIQAKNRAKNQTQEPLNFIEIFEPDVQELISKLKDKQTLEDINGFLRVYLLEKLQKKSITT